MVGSIAAIRVPALGVTPVSPLSGPDPAPDEKRRESTDDRVEWYHHLVKRGHLDLEPIDQPRSDERDHPGRDERRKSAAEVFA